MKLLFTACDPTPVPSDGRLWGFLVVPLRILTDGKLRGRGWRGTWRCSGQQLALRGASLLSTGRSAQGLQWNSLEGSFLLVTAPACGK